MGSIRFITLLFLSLWSLLTPLSYRVFTFHDSILLGILKKPIHFITQNSFDIQTQSILSSDSVSLYIWTFFLLILAIIIGSLLNKKYPIRKEIITNWMEKIVLYFLILQLARYGFDKVFKTQFYLPEPNILATELGQLDKDILFWSTMGSSYAYNLFMGITEVLAAGLMIYRRTRVLGLLIALGTIIQIVTINLSFDISVKLFSFVLLLITLVSLQPFGQALFRFMIQGKSTSLPKISRLHLGKQEPTLKLLVILLFVFECIFPAIHSNNFNDDKAARPFLHGMYQNEQTNTQIWRIFFHRDGFLIFEDRSGVKSDYAVQINEARKILTLTNYDLESSSIPFEFDPIQKKMTLLIQGQEFRFNEVNWREMPLMQNQWHWTVDGGF